jgi:SDR family mycofactocin-dependent oxidoreductase
MGKLDGKVAFITGVARGQGRSHALRLAGEGADIIGVDICAQIDTVPYPLATPDELAETAKMVEALDRRIYTQIADVRDKVALKAAFEAGVAEIGPVDIVLANAGIGHMAIVEPEGIYQDVLDVNLTGVFNTVEIAIPSMTARGAGGAIVLTGSMGGNNGIGGPSAGGLAYSAAKHALVGLMRNYANQLGPHNIRCNVVHPTGVNTMLIMNDAMRESFAANPELGGRLTKRVIDVPYVEPIDISNAMLFLVSDEARYITGVELPVDAGYTVMR